MNRRSLSLLGGVALEAVVDGLAVEGGHHVAFPDDRDRLVGWGFGVEEEQGAFLEELVEVAEFAGEEVGALGRKWVVFEWTILLQREVVCAF